MNKVPDFLVEKNPGLADAMRALPIPENGNCYAPSDDTLMALPETERIKRSVFGDMPIQAGYCNGRGFTLNAEEYHRCSEVNFTTTGLVLLLALPEDIIDRSLDSSRVVGFYLPPDTPVDSALPGEDGLLWMRNKWMLCHPDSPQAQKGAFVGITGENIALNI